MPRAERSLPRRSWAPALAAARALFVPGNRFGVVAFGIGPRITNGRRRETIALNVYVRRKLTAPRVPVPKLEFDVGRARWETMPNVIATGKRPRAAAGGLPEYSGLHAGAVVTVRGATPGRGALACLLATRGNPTHALTAGHVFPEGALGAAVFAAPSPSERVRAIGTLAANFLDQSGVDGALVELNAAGVKMVASWGPPLTDFLPERSVWGKLTCAYLATAGDYSRQVGTEDMGIDAHLWAPTRGVFVVRDALQTDGEITHAGDSGTVLCTGTSNNLAVGVCSGATGAHSVFEPFARILSLARAQVDDELTIF
jgi:hypothetical protein